LIDNGYPVRKIDIDREPELKHRFGVRGVPCFVLVDARKADGQQELARVTGPASYARLARMFEDHRASGAQNEPGARPAAQVTARGQSPDKLAGNPTRKVEIEGAAPDNPFSHRTRAPLPTLSQPSSAPGAPAANAAHAANPAIDPAVVQAALAASVLITVEERRGRSHGTGAIIDVHNGEALILTCGHLFRDLSKDARISIQLGAVPTAPAIPAKVLDFDATERDIGLMHARLGNAQVAPIQVAASGKAAKIGAAAFSVGCDFGTSASVVHGRITAENRYLGAPTISAEGLPVVGRSGGGLFNAEGQLVGVCNYADKEYREGLYASLATIHWQLDRIGLREVYARANAKSPSTEESGGEMMGQSVAQSLHEGATREAAPRMPQRMPDAPNGVSQLSVSDLGAATLAEASAEADAEVICIVRSRRRPNEKPNVIVMESASPELLKLLESAQARQISAGAISRVSDSRQIPAHADSRLAPIYRGQSQD
jgi:S1-C subfamily serine protease